MDNNSSERRLKDRSEQLEEAKRDMNSSLATAIVTGLAIAGSFIIGNIPTIENEVLQEAAEMIRHFLPLFGYLMLANTGLYFLFKKDVKKLTSEEHKEDAEKR